MFEKYEKNRLFNCAIYDMIPYYVDNLGGCFSITGENCGSYETVVYLNKGLCIDINNPNRIINVFESPVNSKPMKSKNFHLYSLDVNSLSKYEGKNESKTLRKVPFIKIK